MASRRLRDRTATYQERLGARACGCLDTTQVDNRLRRISSGGLDSVLLRRICCELEFSSCATFNFPLEGNYLLATSGGYTKQILARIYDPLEEVAAQCCWWEEKK